MKRAAGTSVDDLAMLLVRIGESRNIAVPKDAADRVATQTLELASELSSALSSDNCLLSSQQVQEVLSSAVIEHFLSMLDSEGVARTAL